ncbi:MAG: hypothetical protein AAF556_10025, partial [Pseudomonadota bacterium]
MPTKRAISPGVELLHLDPAQMHHQFMTSSYQRVCRRLWLLTGLLAVLFIMLALNADARAATFAEGSRNFRTIELTFGK